MSTISITYALKYRLKFANNYQWDDNCNCFNLKTGRKIKQVLNSRCIGYCINGRFYSLKYLRSELERIPKKEILPF